MTPRQVERGAEIFDKDDVIKFDKSGANVDAIIHDRKKYYNVNLKFQNQRLKSAKCNCPDSNKKKHCAHIAAALFATANEFEDKPTRQKREVKESINRTVNLLPPRVLKSFLRSFVEKDPETADKVFFSPLSDETNLKLSEIDARFKDLEEKVGELSADVLAYDEEPEEYSMFGYEEFTFEAPYDYDYRDDYEELFRLRAKRIGDLLNRTLNGIRDNILGRNDFRVALQSVWHFIDALQKDDRVYSNEYTLSFVEAVGEFLLDIINHTKDKKYREKLIDRLKRDLDDGTKFYRVWIAKGVLTKIAHQEAKANKGKRQKTVYVPDVFPGFEHNPVLNARERLYAMWGNDYSEKDIEAYLEPYKRFPPIIEFEDDYYSSRKEFDKAIRAVETVLTYKDLTREELAPYHLRLANIYQKMEDEEREKKALKDFVENKTQEKLDEINRIKALMREEEWQAYIAEVEKFTSELTYMDLLMQEGLKETLYDRVMAFDHFVDLSTYDAYLYDEYGASLEEERVKQFKEEIEKLRGRESYILLIKNLDWLKVFPNWEEDIAEIVSYWRENFKRKDALMEELYKAGY